MFLFHFNAAQDKAFHDFKCALTNAPVLVFPDYQLPFIIYTDASALGLGAVLMQADANGKNHVIAYASRTLNPAVKLLCNSSGDVSRGLGS